MDLEENVCSLLKGKISKIDYLDANGIESFEGGEISEVIYDVNNYLIRFISKIVIKDKKIGLKRTHSREYIAIPKMGIKKLNVGLTKLSLIKEFEAEVEKARKEYENYSSSEKPTIYISTKLGYKPDKEL